MRVLDKIVVCSVGRMAAQKNPYFALDVIKEVSSRQPNLVYWWIGTGSLESEIKQYTRDIGIENIVCFLGGRTDMPELYQAVDVFFLPSLFEGLPVTGVETQAVGLPSVVSNTVTDEMVFTDLVEFVSLDEPIEKWVDAIEAQIQRIKNRRSYTKELKNSIFSMKNAGRYLENLYESYFDEVK